MPNLFTPHTPNQQLNGLTKLYPSGKPFAAKEIEGSVFRKMLKSLVPEVERFESTLLQLSREIDINESEVLIDEWEKSVGIPDDCFSNTGTLSERQKNVLIKLGCMNVSTADDYITLAAKLGKTITVTPAADESFPPYPVPFIPLSDPTAKFTMIVRGTDVSLDVPPYDVPFTPGLGDDILNCVFNKVKPANVKIIFLNA